jgi:hypothetical protein
MESTYPKQHIEQPGRLVRLAEEDFVAIYKSMRYNIAGAYPHWTISWSY